MADKFDPYYKWLGIPPKNQPPNHYQLLSIRLWEGDPDVIANSGDRQMAHVKTFQSGKHSAESQKLLNELATAQSVLLNPDKKAAYDAQLKAKLKASARPPRKKQSDISPPIIRTTPSPSRRSSKSDAISTKAGSGKRHKKQTPAWQSPMVLGGAGAGLVLLVLIFLLVGGRGGNPPKEAPDRPDSPKAETKKEGPEIAALKDKTAFPGENFKVNVRLSNWNKFRGVKYTAGEQNPEDSQVDPDTGQFTWAVPEGLPPKKYTVTILSQLKGYEPDEKSFVVTVKAIPPSPSLPVLEAISDKTTKPGKPVAFTVKARDPDNPEGTDSNLKFSLEGGPSGAEIDESTGKFTWTPDKDGEDLELEKPYYITVTVRKTNTNMHPKYRDLVLKASKRFRIWLGKAATGPKLAALTDQSVLQGDDVEVIAGLSNANQFSEGVKYTAGKQNPRGSHVDPDTGLFTWSIPRDLPPDKYTVTVIAQVEGYEPDEKNFVIAVNTASVVERPVKKVVDVPARKLKGGEIPDKETQAEELKTIRDLFQDEYADKSQKGREALALKLLQEAIGQKDKAGRYVLLDEAVAVATEVGDPITALEAIHFMDQHYDIDSVKRKKTVIQNVGSKANTPQQNRVLASTMLGIIQDALKKNDYDEAASLTSGAVAAARKVSRLDRSLLPYAQALKKDVTEAKKDHEQYKEALEVLKKDKGNPGANLTVGKFQLFHKFDFKNALSHLEKASDEKLHSLAKSELDRPETLSKQLELAKAWWTVASSAPSGLKDRLKRRAGYWYRKANQEAEGLNKKLIEQKLKLIPPVPSFSLSGPTPSDSSSRHALVAKGTLRLGGTIKIHYSYTDEDGDRHTRYKTLSPKDFKKKEPYKMPSSYKMSTINVASRGLTDLFLAQLTGMESLKEVTIASPNVTDFGISHLNSLSELETLTLSNTQISDMGVIKLGNLSNLQTLTIDGGRLSGTGFAHTKGLTSLKNLTLVSNNLSDTGLSGIAKLPALKHLTLFKNDMSDLNYEYLKGAGKLSSLSLVGNQFSGKSLATLGQIPSLPPLTIRTTELTSEGIKGLAKPTSLRTLNLQLNKLPGRDLGNLSDSSSLRTLTLTTEVLTHADMAGLNELTQLSRLVIKSKIMKFDFGRLQPWSSLKELSLTGGFTSSSVGRIDTVLPNLQKVTLVSPLMSDAVIGKLKNISGLTSITVGSPSLSDAGLAVLGKMTDLTYLRLRSGPRITNKGLSRLSGLKNLKDLYLPECKIDYKGYSSLRSKLPKCEFHGHRPKKPSRDRD